MTVPMEQFLADIDADRLAAIEAGAAEIVAEQQTISALRRARGMTQAQVAEAMETSQANVAQLERKGDALISTIGRVVRALGAELEVSARFPDGSTVPLKIGATGEVTAQPAPSVVRTAQTGERRGLRGRNEMTRSTRQMAAIWQNLSQRCADIGVSVDLMKVNPSHEITIYRGNHIGRSHRRNVGVMQEMQRGANDQRVINEIHGLIARESFAGL